MSRGKVLSGIFPILFLIATPAAAGQLSRDDFNRFKKDLLLLGVAGAQVELNVRIRVPRGKNPYAKRDNDLWATVIIPPERLATPGPAIFMVTAYRREIMLHLYLGLIKHGYTLVGLDAGGTGSSDGYWHALGLEEQYDAKYCIDDWIPSRRWSDGVVGMIGSSYTAISQLNVAGIVDRDPVSEEPLHLKAAFPIMGGCDMYREIGMPGGTQGIEFITSWISYTNFFALWPPLLLMGEDGWPTGDDILTSLKVWTTHFVNTQSYYAMALTDPNLEYPNTWYFQRSPMTHWPVKPAGGWGFPEGELPFPRGTAMLLTSGWFDIFTYGGFNNYQYGLAAHRRGDKALIVGEWYHLSGVLSLGVSSMTGMSLASRWFDWKLKGVEDPFLVRFPVLLYVMGINRWRAERDWPLPAGRVEAKTFYLSKKRPSFIPGDWFTHVPGNPTYALVEDPDEIAAHRDNPVFTHSINPLLWKGLQSRSCARWSAGSQSLIFEFGEALKIHTDVISPYEDERLDEYGVLTFTTEPLESDLEIAGPLLLRFWGKSEFIRAEGALIREAIKGVQDLFRIDRNLIINQLIERDVQFVVELNDVNRSGRARNVSSGWLRASRRPYDPDEPADATEHDLDPGYTPFDPFYYGPFFSPRPVAEDEYYHYAVELLPTCNVFKAGHRIRLSISGSDVPHLVPILYTSHNTIIIDREHPATLTCTTVNRRDEGNTWQWIDRIDSYLLENRDELPDDADDSGPDVFPGSGTQIIPAGAPVTIKGENELFGCVSTAAAANGERGRHGSPVPGIATLLAMMLAPFLLRRYGFHR